MEKERVLKRSQERLEYPELLQFLSELCKSEPGRAKASQLLPSESLEKVKRDLELLREMMALLNMGLEPPLSYFSDFSSLLENALKGINLMPKHFLELAEFLMQAEESKNFFKKKSHQFPKLAELSTRIQNFSELKDQIESVFDNEGEIKDSASPELARLRQELVLVRAQIQKKLELLLRAKELEELLQDHFYTEREGRFVIPVKSQAQSRVAGIVQDSSASGATVFLEPMELIPLNNRLRMLRAEIDAEVEKILARLTQEVVAVKEPLLLALDSLTELDLIQAKAQLGRRLSGSIPEVGSGSILKLYQARHPLLILRGKEAVPNDLVLEPETKVLIISGPNTGGKTVFLKTIGILSLMLRAGLPLPVHPDSELGFFPEVYAEIGDEQNLAQELSSYSAHLLDLISFLKYGKNSSLILVDEILGSTDPEEGSALAISILREFKRRDCLTIVTTHLSRLKGFAENEPGFKNASFEFDPEHLLPTYRLRLGLPGPSYGIATARKLGLKRELIEEAENLLDPSARKIMELVSELDRKQSLLDQRLRELEREELEAQARAQQLEEKDRALLAKEQALKKELRQQLESELRRVKVRLNQIFEEAKVEQSREKVRRAEKELFRIQEELEQRYPEPEVGEELKPEEWKKGDLAWVQKLRTTAEVIEVNLKERSAHLAIGSLRISEKLSGLRRIKSRTERKAEPGQSPETETESAVYFFPSASNTLDLRGLRAEEAEIELINFLDRSAREGKLGVYIIHGHGTGVLKKLVREYLASSSYVRSFRPGEQSEGGDGITLAVLEKMRTD